MIKRIVTILLVVMASTRAADEMVRLPAGSYLPLYMKNPKPRPVAGFFLDVHPVTNSQFLEFVRENPKWQRSKVKRIFADGQYLKHWGGDLDLGPDAEKIADSPVVNISWFAARAYLKSKGKRLPTTDEWELAACADETRANATDDPKFTARLLEWYGQPGGAQLPSVKIAPINYYGIRALHGYAWEWVDDFNNSMVTGESRGDSGIDRKLYCAGGALGATDTRNYAAFMRYAFRSSLKGNYTVPNLSFRGARDIDPNDTNP
jgi:formylglycine-generating enzyme required for sulfatase activity